MAADVEERSAFLAVMPAYVPAERALTTKLVSLFPLNEGTETPTHQALIAVFDAPDGRPVALIDGTHVTAARTAAGSALSVRLLAREDAEDARRARDGRAGSRPRAGGRARATVEEVLLAGRDAERTAAAAAELASELELHGAARDPRAGRAGADVVCACTGAVEVVVRREWLGRAPT